MLPVVKSYFAGFRWKNTPEAGKPDRNGPAGEEKWEAAAPGAGRKGREEICGKNTDKDLTALIRTWYNKMLLYPCFKSRVLTTLRSALHRILLERIKSGESSILSTRISGEEDPITLDEIITAVNKEDLLCIEIVEEIGQKLGKQIAGLINIFNPELVIIGGTLSLTGDYITQPIKTAVRKYSLNLVNKDSAIITSKLKDKAGIVGACMLARSRMFES